MPEIIFDGCVLSNFALSDSLPVIRNMYPNVSYLTDFVSAEIMGGIQKGYTGLVAIRETLRNGWLEETTLHKSKGKALFESLSVSLGLGEASSIAIAKIRGFAFVCDDRAARREASLLGIKMTGTLGILKKATKMNLVNLKKADLILKSMIEHGFYSPVNSIKEIF